MAEIATIASLVSAIGTAAAAGLQVMQAQQQAGAMRNQAALLSIQARQQELSARSIEQRGQMEALNTRDQLLRVLAAQNARYAAGGLALDDGTPATVAEQTARDAERQLQVMATSTELDAASARIGAAGTQQRARLLADQAGWTSTAGWLGAAATAGRGAVDWWARQPGTVVPPPGGGQR
jgi:hypothetical protein